MIRKLSIRNFKSIRELDLDCKKVNLFIGEPNTGKSNMLETLGLLNWIDFKKKKDIKDFIRMKQIHDLFYDGIIDENVSIEIKGKINETIEIGFKDDIFNISRLYQSNMGHIVKKPIYSFDFSGEEIKVREIFDKFRFIKIYKFLLSSEFPDRGMSYLSTPHGSNMFSVVYGKKRLRAIMSKLFKNFGFQLVYKLPEKIFEFQKQVDDEVFSYPYILVSDTLQRIIFHVIAIESNKDSTLVFEEPESHAFPYYTKYLGEKIAMDESNQYFIATHNPYLLLSILEKAKKEDVNVFITYYKEYQTKVKCITGDQLSQLMEYDPFANLDVFIGEE